MQIERKNKNSTVIPTSSMSDIAFLLLIFFMVSSLADADKELEITLPQSRISVQTTQKYFNIWIDKKGDIYYRGNKTTPPALTTHATYKLMSDPDVRALIRAEQDARYESVNAVMNALKDAGCTNVVFVSEKKAKNIK